MHPPNLIDKYRDSVAKNIFKKIQIYMDYAGENICHISRVS